jgi:hypothetical protein
VEELQAVHDTKAHQARKTQAEADSLRAWEIKESGEAAAADQQATELSVAEESDEGAVQSAHSDVNALENSADTSVEAYLESEAEYQGLVETQIAAEEHSSNVYQHQVAIARRAVGLVENATHLESLIPPEVKEATEQKDETKAADVKATEHMDAAKETWIPANQARQNSAAAMSEANTLYTHLTDVVLASVQSQKDAAYAFAATSLSNFNTASDAEDTKRSTRINKQSDRDATLIAWEEASELEDFRVVELKQAEADQVIKEAIWREKEEKLEAARVAKELAIKAWEAAEADKAAKFPAVATTEGAAVVAETAAAIARARADELKAWLDLLIKGDDEDEVEDDSDRL